MEYEFILDPLVEEGGYKKKSFGGLSIYLDGRLVISLMDSDETVYRGVDYGIMLWKGLLVPTSKENHKKLKEKFPSLVPHPFLKKWMFLPASEEFEELASEIIHYIALRGSLIGVEPRTPKSRDFKKKPFKKGLKETI